MLVPCAAVCSLALVAIALAPAPPALAAALLLDGSCIAPAFATLYAMVGDLAREGTLTESYTWLTTGITGGVAAGAAARGAVVDRLSTHAAMGGAALMVAPAALVATAGRRMPAAPAQLGWRA